MSYRSHEYTIELDGFEYEVLVDMSEYPRYLIESVALIDENGEPEEIDPSDELSHRLYEALYDKTADYLADRADTARDAAEDR